ncbi:unnamed protein product, partial [Symbiodinium pilosum]
AFAATRTRGRSAIKVSLSYGLAFFIDLSYGFDSVLVCSVGYLSSYGSQYAGGSLRRATSRGVGVAAGATVGSLLRHLSLAEEGALPVTLACIGVWAFATMLVYFRKGPYAYVGFCAAFTAIKFLSCLPGSSMQLATTVTSTMYACLLAAVVELTVLPVDARDLLQFRVASSLLGMSLVLPALATADGSQQVTMPSKGVDTSISSISFTGRKGVTAVPVPLPDLTDRLRELGAYEKYLEWRDGYLRWRQGNHRGSKGEVTESEANGLPPKG